MQFKPVTSTAVDALGYDSECNVLGVLFKNKTVYFYTGVPFSVYADFVTAESKGGFHAAAVRNRYVFFKPENLEVIVSAEPPVV